MHLSNPHRQLQVTAFNAEVDKFYDYAETGKVCPSSTSFCCNVGQAELWPAAEACVLACTKNKKSLNFASSGSWHLKVGMETPENNFQIYRPINDPWRALCSLERGYRWGNIQKSILGNNF